MSLAEVLASHRVVVTVGSGGVGKTTSAAALAVHAAMQGRRVLCLTIDPARRLANSLGLSEMTSSEQEVPRELFEAAGLELRGSLAAMMLDTKKTFDTLVANLAKSPEARDRILNNEIYKYVSGSLAGTQEYMAMEKLFEVRKDPQWDLVVLDTPPTANALDFLDAPERLVGAIDSPATRWFVQAYESSQKGAFGALLSKGASMLLNGLSKFTGADFLKQIAEFIAGLNELFGGFREHAEEVSAALRSPDVAFLVVTSPHPLAVREAMFFSDKLKDAGMRRDGVIVNQVHQLLPEPKASDEELAQILAPHLPEGTEPGDAVARMMQALEDERMRAVADRVETDRLRHHLGPSVRMVEVPALEADVHDIQSLAEVSRYLTGEATSAL
ncbi:MAG: ArsA family ATPase [Myxococcales bacterium]|nr:ArsA family ATPase [Myxococcales bacterium]